MKRAWIHDARAAHLFIANLVGVAVKQDIDFVGKEPRNLMFEVAVRDADAYGSSQPR